MPGADRMIFWAPDGLAARLSWEAGCGYRVNYEQQGSAMAGWLSGAMAGKMWVNFREIIPTTTMFEDDLWHQMDPNGDVGEWCKWHWVHTT